MAFNITTFSIMTFSTTINKIRHLEHWQSVVMLRDANNPFMQTVVMLNVIMLSVVAPHMDG
jgi:hypothetical protein